MVQQTVFLPVCIYVVGLKATHGINNGGACANHMLVVGGADGEILCSKISRIIIPKRDIQIKPNIRNPPVKRFRK